MKNLFLLCTCVLLYNSANELVAQDQGASKQVKTDQYCQFIYVESNATTKVANKGVQPMSANACGNYYVNVFFHFIRDNNGSTGQPVSRISQYMNILNGAYNGRNVFFANKGYDEIKNSTWAATNFNHFNLGAYSGTNNQSNALNIYLFRDDKSGGGGIAYTPGTSLGIGGGDQYAASYSLTNVLAHEVGHNLNLLHTFHWTFSGEQNAPTTCVEDPNGSNGSTCGDLVADTPADPNINFTNNGNCSSPMTIVANGGITYHPSVTNIMSYATANCLSTFTTGQASRFQSALNSLSVLQPVQQISIAVSGPSAICSATNFTLLGVPPGATITWSTSSNIQIVSGQGTSSTNLQPSSGGSGTGTITATASICGTTYNTSIFYVNVGAPVISSFKVNGQPFTNGNICKNSQQSIEALPFNSFNSYTWSISSGVASHASLSSSGNTALFQAYYAECFGVSVTAQNACGSVQTGLSFCAQNCFAKYTVQPNPVKDQFAVEFDQTDNAAALPDELDLLSESSLRPLRTVDVQAEYKNNRLINGNSIVLNVKDLPRGTYYLHIKNSRNSESPVDKIRIILE